MHQLLNKTINILCIFSFETSYKFIDCWYFFFKRRFKNIVSKDVVKYFQNIKVAPALNLLNKSMSSLRYGDQNCTASQSANFHSLPWPSTHPLDVTSSWLNTPHYHQAPRALEYRSGVAKHLNSTRLHENGSHYGLQSESRSRFT